MKIYKQILFLCLMTIALAQPSKTITISLWDSLKDKSTRSASAILAGLRRPDKSPAAVVEKEALKYKSLLDLSFDKKSGKDIAIFILNLQTSSEIAADAKNKTLAKGEHTNKKGYEVLSAILQAIKSLPQTKATFVPLTKGYEYLEKDDEHYNLIRSIQGFELRLKKLEKNINDALEYITIGTKKNIVAQLKAIPDPNAR